MAQLHGQRQERAAVQPEQDPGAALGRRYAAEIAVLAKLATRGGILCPICDCAMAIDPWWRTVHWACARAHSYSNPRALYDELQAKGRIPQDLAREVTAACELPPAAAASSAPETPAVLEGPHIRGTPR